jgi:DNA invertase Pin-like site-specific DNA recombinase
MPGGNQTASRCAVYTRKSSDEGLEQSFNSLDAQREACIAYIQSQRHEGWRLWGTRYDDGGYSGGTLERPALKLLLTDIGAGLIDIVVVYKVDRLTRSLTDFAKIVELFEARGVSFISITQHFNTTTSMGRLTLNVLLSFAQFEREVTGERIRDKIAASKRKGMWMGGRVPLGYDVKDRKLVVNELEAAIVRDIYGQYLRLGCVRKLKDELDRRDIRSKLRIAASGATTGGTAFSRGALYRILTNRLYLGEITHRGKVYPGQHDSLIPAEIWDKTQLLLKSNRQAKREGVKAKDPSLLAGILYDGHGNRFTPAHALKNSKRYRYYVSRALIKGQNTAGMARRIPAHDLEGVVIGRLQVFLRSATDIFATAPSEDISIQTRLLSAASDYAAQLDTLAAATARAFLLAILAEISVNEGSIEIKVNVSRLRQFLLGESKQLTWSAEDNFCQVSQLQTIRIDARLKRCGGR